jgi:flagellar biosynthetic protein FlhB
MDTADRTIPATPRRREAARRQGMMPLSSLPAWLAGVLVAVALAPAWAAATLPAAADMLRRVLATAGREAAFDAAAVADLRLLLPTILVIAASSAAAIAVRVLLDGAAWRPARIVPAWQRVDPLAGMGRIFSRSTAASVAGNALALAVLGAATLWSVSPLLASVDVVTATTDPVRLIAIGQRAILPVVAVAAGVAAVQWGVARRRFESRIRMTPQEYQDEARSLQADPKVRLMREQAGRRPAPAGR